MRNTPTDKIAQAIGDPGSIVARGQDETVTRWSTRAVETVLEDERSFGDMYERAYFGVQTVLDSGLGSEEEDGAGMGIVADVALLCQRYDDLKRTALEDGEPAGGWRRRIAEIETADLREPTTRPKPEAANDTGLPCCWVTTCTPHPGECCNHGHPDSCPADPLGNPAIAPNPHSESL